MLITVTRKEIVLVGNAIVTQAIMAILVNRKPVYYVQEMDIAVDMDYAIMPDVYVILNMKANNVTLKSVN